MIKTADCLLSPHCTTWGLDSPRVTLLSLPQGCGADLALFFNKDAEEDETQIHRTGLKPPFFCSQARGLTTPFTVFLPRPRHKPRSARSTEGEGALAWGGLAPGELGSQGQALPLTLGVWKSGNAGIAGPRATRG